MSLKTFSTLEVTGNILEIPPPKEATSIVKVGDKIRSKPFYSNNTENKRAVIKSVISSNSADSTKKSANQHKICQVKYF
jgi:hypothetical protein